MTTEALYRMIVEIDWSPYETAYGNAAQEIPHFQGKSTPSIPSSLRALFSGDRKKAMDATNNLWCALCHQHAFLSSAALPAYDFLMIGLKELDDKLKVELLDIFLGFAACTARSADKLWEKQLRDKLKADLSVFKGFISSENEDISYFSERIVEELAKEAV